MLFFGDDDGNVELFQRLKDGIDRPRAAVLTERFHERVESLDGNSVLMPKP